MNASAIANLSREELIALVADMAKANDRKLTLKISAKGALCAYGLGKFPVTLYVTQWEKLLASSKDIAAFIEANRPLLSTVKPVKAEPVKAVA